MSKQTKNESTAKPIAKRAPRNHIKKSKADVAVQDPPAEVQLAHVEAVAPVQAGKRTIEKDREMRNGVKRPSAGGLCRAVWDFCESTESATGAFPTVKAVKLEAEARGWNPNNASIEYYQARKFHGIRGRAPKVEAAAPEASAQ